MKQNKIKEINMNNFLKRKKGRKNRLFTSIWMLPFYTTLHVAVNTKKYIHFPKAD